MFILSYYKVILLGTNFFVTTFGPKFINRLYPLKSQKRTH